MGLQLDRQAPALDLDEMGHAVGPDAGAGDRDPLVAGDDRDADQLVEVLRLGDGLLLDDDPALLGHRGRIDEVDLLLGAPLQRPAGSPRA